MDVVAAEIGRDPVSKHQVQHPFSAIYDNQTY